MSIRGIRNNNPLNLRRSADKWQGLAATQPDAEFFTFKDMTYGIRAGARVLIKYYDSYGLDTIDGIIRRWAPKTENDTQAYIKLVSDETGNSPELKLDLHKFSDLFPLVKAMLKEECGANACTDAQITKGLVLAGVEPERKSVAKTPAVKSAQVAAGATTVSVAATAVTQFAPAFPLLQDMAQYAPYVLGAIVLIAVGFFVWDQIDARRKGIR